MRQSSRRRGPDRHRQAVRRPQADRPAEGAADGWAWLDTRDAAEAFRLALAAGSSTGRFPNFYAHEHIIDLSSATSTDLAILRNPEVLVAVSGHIERPTGPGLGIEVDEDAVRAAHRDDLLVPAGSPLWTYPDGGFAEW